MHYELAGEGRNDSFIEGSDPEKKKGAQPRDIQLSLRLSGHPETREVQEELL